MERIQLTSEIRVFGLEVENFPHDIGAAFSRLANLVEGGFNRPYYGICEMKEGSAIYRAAAQEMYEGEGEKYACKSYVIEKGTYLAVTVHDWRRNTESIKDVFEDILEDDRVDFAKPFVEWYKDDMEMICMARERKGAML
ncbi:MAG TPA: hypothetical protein VKZ68_10705 [Ohtaekwangia sp.]|nr:hypothetical protein [Ohtaekwangia sp.]